MAYKVEELEKALNYSGPDKVVSWVEYLQEKDNKSKFTAKLLSGFELLDGFLDGFIGGEVIVLSGLTGNGKTLFAKSVIRNMAQQNVPCLCLSYEVSTVEFLRAFRNQGLEMAKAYVPKELKTGFIPWVEEKIIEAKVKYDNKVLLIDHLHYVVDMKTDKMTQNIGAAMRCLKEIAIKHDQVIFLIAHQEKLKDDREPGIETLRDSSFVGQEADTVLIVHRLPDSEDKRIQKTYDLGFALVKIDKARRSGVYKKRLTFQKRGDWLEAV